MSEKVLGEYIIRLVCGEIDGNIVPVRATIETKPIVRCIDCVRFSTDDYGCAWCNWVCAAISPDDYCAWGERKSE